MKHSVTYGVFWWCNFIGNNVLFCHSECNVSLCCGVEQDVSALRTANPFIVIFTWLYCLHSCTSKGWCDVLIFWSLHRDITRNSHWWPFRVTRCICFIYIKDTSYVLFHHLHKPPSSIPIYNHYRTSLHVLQRYYDAWMSRFMRFILRNLITPYRLCYACLGGYIVHKSCESFNNIVWNLSHFQIRIWRARAQGESMSPQRSEKWRQT